MTKLFNELRLFISSTFLDLQDYRQAVFTAVTTMGNPAEDMIYWSADEREPSNVSLDRVRRSDVFILLLAHRYGCVPEGRLQSITEQEYTAARSHGIPILAFLVDDELPWPPQYVEWERRDQLLAFKKKVRSEVTVTTFRSPDHLGAIVTQALVSFQRRHGSWPSTIATTTRRKLSVIVDSATNLGMRPDLTIQIGRAEDDIPLLLQIRRSRDLDSVFKSVSETTDRLGFTIPTAVISTFRQSIEHDAQKAWATERVGPVRMRDGTIRDFFIAPKPLTSLFRSSFEDLLTGVRAAIPSTSWLPLLPTSLNISRVMGSRPPTTNSGLYKGLFGPLQSEGGSNRFLAIGINDGCVYSVGHPRDDWTLLQSEWVEWRPFIFESVPHHFPDANFRVGRESSHGVSVERYQQILLESALSIPGQNPLDIPVYIEIPKNSVAAFIANLARSVAELHERDNVHGDLKPSNLLLASDGIRLIDDFQLKIGEIAPGWTPNWSAPEQTVGEPVSVASDIYPFGLMITQLLRGQLVGEVRKFKTAQGSNRREEFDIFYNPSVYVSPESSNGGRTISRAWADLARRCLRFRPEERPLNMHQLAVEIDTVRQDCPLEGRCSLEMKPNFEWTVFPDGSDGLARVIRIDMSHT